MESQFCSGNRTLFRLDLSGATDLLALGVERPVVNAALETTLPENLGTAFAVPILPVARSVVSNLAASGIGEGTGFAMAPSADGLLLATSDSYRLWERLPLAGGAIGGVCTSFLDFVALTSIGQFSLTPRSFDPSRQDAGLGLRNEPVLGLRQVTELLRAPTLSSDMVYAIDGGLARQVPGSPGFDESVAARDLVLDTTVFSDAAELQSDSRIGELQVSSLDGDSDGDGIFESIHAFGGRSLMTFDTELAVLSDTGDSVDRELRRRDPMGLARYEALAPTSGARGVRAIPVTPTDNQIVVAFPGAGLVAIFDGSNPASPRFVGILPSQVGAQPVDLAGFYATLVGGEFVEMVLVLDRGNGTVDVIRRGPF